MLRISLDVIEYNMEEQCLQVMDVVKEELDNMEEQCLQVIIPERFLDLVVLGYETIAVK